MEGRAPASRTVARARHRLNRSSRFTYHLKISQRAAHVPVRWKPWPTEKLASSASARVEEASLSAYDANLQRLLMAGPPADFDFRAEVTPASRRWVDEHAPQLRDLVEDGTLVVVPRRPDYVERRTDGYLEPQVVLLVGTAHVSRRSQQDVTRVVRAVTPDSVVVELCKSRSAALAAQTAAAAPPTGTAPGSDTGVGSGPQPGSAVGPGALTFTKAPSPSSFGQAHAAPVSASGSGTDSDTGELYDRVYSNTNTADGDTEQRSTGSGGARAATRSLSPPPYVNPLNLAGGAAAGGDGGGSGGGGFLGAVARSVSLGGQSALLLRVLLAGLASRTAGSLGVAGGGEFAAAQAAAEEVGAQVVLGDRPVEITLSRAWAALPLRRRAALCGELLRGVLGTTHKALSEELVERLKSDDTVGAFFKQLSTSYPELVGPLITERDLYLAWSLKRSKAVNGARVVVVVIGRGHLRGVVYTLLRDQGGAGLRFTELVDGRNNRSRRRAQAAQGAARLGVELALGTAAYVIWSALANRPS